MIKIKKSTLIQIINFFISSLTKSYAKKVMDDINRHTKK